MNPSGSVDLPREKCRFADERRHGGLGSAIVDSGVRLKRLIKTEPALYYWVCLYRRRVLRQDIRLAGPNTRLCIEGYPSSGNTFAISVVRQAWPGLSVASHRHCIAAVRRALQLSVPTIVLLRQPEEAISSNAVRFGVPARRAAGDYCLFYEWAASEPQVKPVDFDTMISRPQALVSLVGELVGMPPPIHLDLKLQERFRENASKAMEQWQVKPQEWWVPHPQKESLKAGIKDQLFREGELIRHAWDVYARLKVRAVI